MERTRRLFSSSTVLTKQSSPSCIEILQLNEQLLDNVIENPMSLVEMETSVEDTNLGSSSSEISSCSSEDKNNLEFQIKLLQSATNIILNTLVGIQDNLKNKYFFDNVLDFMKFLTDEPS